MNDNRVLKVALKTKTKFLKSVCILSYRGELPRYTYFVTVAPGIGFKHVKSSTTLQKIEYILTIYPLSFLRETIVYN